MERCRNHKQHSYVSSPGSGPCHSHWCLYFAFGDATSQKGFSPPVPLITWPKIRTHKCLLVQSSHGLMPFQFSALSCSTINCSDMFKLMRNWCVNKHVKWMLYRWLLTRIWVQHLWKSGLQRHHLPFSSFSWWHGPRMEWLRWLVPLEISEWRKREFEGNFLKHGLINFFRQLLTPLATMIPALFAKTVSCIDPW